MSSRSLDKGKQMAAEKETRVMGSVDRPANRNPVREMGRSAMQAGGNRIGALVPLAVLALLFGFPAARAQQSSDAAPSGNAQNGKKLIMSYGCYECHGREGQGSTQTGAARIGPPQLSFEGFQSYVRAPKNQMPPYSSKAVSDQDLADIYAYLKSIPMPPKGKDIPLLNK
jgi:mono/diheme cytochrome c family protein